RDTDPESAHELDQLDDYIADSRGRNILEDFWRQAAVVGAYEDFKRRVAQRRLDGYEELNDGIRRIGGVTVVMKDGSQAKLTGLGKDETAMVFPVIDHQADNFDNIQGLVAESDDESN